jgi:hypothetical protein
MVILAGRTPNLVGKIPIWPLRSGKKLEYKE